MTYGRRSTTPTDCADLERASRAKAELDILIEALAQATGLGGRPRLLNDDSEKARISVRKAIMRALTTIEEADPRWPANYGRGWSPGLAQCIFDSRISGFVVQIGIRGKKFVPSVPSRVTDRHAFSIGPQRRGQMRKEHDMLHSRLRAGLTALAVVVGAAAFAPWFGQRGPAGRDGWWR